jgi:hypothetical protein
MKLVVVAGFTTPGDPDKKSRPAVVLGMVDGRVAIAPCTSSPARKGLCVPRGAVLVQECSPAFAGSNFRCGATAVNIADTALFAIDSTWIRNLHQIGMLDLTLDNRLMEQMRTALKSYDLSRLAR